MIAHNKKFKDTTVHLDGGTFVGCTFERCTLIFSGLMPVHLEGDKFSECNWSLAGPAQNTVDFMRGLYAMGGAEVIEKTFENIKKSATPSAGDKPAVH